MGKIKTTLIKRTSNKLVRNNPEYFSKKFEDNKKLLPKVAEIRSKKLRNIIAGYIARLVKNEL
jgi:small subunit ribosomal protein S17e|tara:strand:+ start:1762 stop:1950 length:189 start_codon:yes stop_codon:yes gene_type:complete